MRAWHRFHGLTNGMGKLCSGLEQVTGSAVFLTGMLDAPFAVIRPLVELHATKTWYIHDTGTT